MATFPPENEWPAFWNRFGQGTVEQCALHLSDWARKNNRSPAEASWFLWRLDALLHRSKKWPRLTQTPGIFFPPKQNAEQASSEATALFKACFLARHGPLHRVFDLTGGSGVDTWALEQSGAQVTVYERDPLLAALLLHNGELLGTQRTVVQGSSDALAIPTDDPVDALLIDPLRRVQGSHRVPWEESEPNPKTHWTDWCQKAKQVLLKTSPMADVHAVEKAFPQANRLLFVEVGGEMKEILVHKGSQDTLSHPSPLRTVVQLQYSGEIISEIEYDPTAENPKPTFVEPMAGAYLYDPGAALIASRCADLEADKWGMHRLCAQSPLYQSTAYFPLWPGRILRIQSVEKPYKEPWEGGWSIVSKDFPEKPASIRSKLHCGEDSERFLYALIDGYKNRSFLRCQKVNGVP